MTNVTLGDNVERGRVIKDVVVEGEVTARRQIASFSKRARRQKRVNVPRNDLDTALLEAGPASLLDVGGSLGELIGRELATPVSLDGLFDLTVST